MTSRLIVLRPEPGASATAKRAAAAGWTVTLLPLFTIEALAWAPPDPGDFDAVLMTSANAARLGGAGLSRYHDLPLYAVGSRTAEAARNAGFGTIMSGASDAGEMADRLRADDAVRVFHPTGSTARPFDETGLTLTHIAVYAATKAAPPDLITQLSDDAIIFVHSPRAAQYLDALCTEQDIGRGSLSLVAISGNALAGAGTGWRAAIAADQPTDDAMLAAASSIRSGP